MGEKRSDSPSMEDLKGPAGDNVRGLKEKVGKVVRKIRWLKENK